MSHSTNDQDSNRQQTDRKDTKEGSGEGIQIIILIYIRSIYYEGKM